MRIDIGTLKNLFYLIKQQKKILFIFTVIITITSLLETLGIGILYPVLSILENKAKAVQYLDIINSMSPLKLEAAHIIPLLFVLVYILFLLRGLFIGLSYYSQFKLSQKLTSMWQSDIFKNYMKQNYDYFIRHKTGDLLQKQMVHTENAGNAVVYSCQIARNFITVVLLSVMLFLISARLMLILAAILVIIVLFSFVISKLKIYSASKEHAQLQEESYSIAAEVIAGIRQVKAFLAEEFFGKRFFKVVDRKASIYTRNATISQIPAPLLQTIVLIGIVTMLFFASYQQGNQSGLFAIIIIFGSAAYRIISSAASINTGFMQIAHLLPSINIVKDLICLESADKGGRSLGQFKDSIKFDNVSFSYSRKSFNLSGIDINFEKGKFYGIVGPSGSGKSTLIDLIIGFYQISNGKILVDDNDIGNIDIYSWRKMIGLISQETFIFHGTIEKNISFATEDTDVVADRVIEAAKSADIHSFIMELPQGYKTTVGERGLRLSGGQRQRLAIARAMYRNPELYIFDEATSSLDTYSERKIQKAIEDLSQSKTVIAVAHRLSTIINADKIIVMREGRIIETGSHKELLEKKGFYADLYEHQHNQNS